jgi:hypothetical protein
LETENKDGIAGSADTVILADTADSADLIAMLAVLLMPDGSSDLLNPAGYCKAETLV